MFCDFFSELGSDQKKGTLPSVPFQYFYKYPQITKAGDDFSPPLILSQFDLRQHAKILFRTRLLLKLP